MIWKSDFIQNIFISISCEEMAEEYKWLPAEDWADCPLPRVGLGPPGWPGVACSWGCHAWTGSAALPAPCVWRSGQGLEGSVRGGTYFYQLVLGLSNPEWADRAEADNEGVVWTRTSVPCARCTSVGVVDTAVEFQRSSCGQELLQPEQIDSMTTGS